MTEEQIKEISKNYDKQLSVLAEKYIPSNYPCIKKRTKAKDDQKKLISDISDIFVKMIHTVSFMSIEDRQVDFILQGEGTQPTIKGLIDKKRERPSTDTTTYEKRG
jgi:hypothetical protein